MAKLYPDRSGKYTGELQGPVVEDHNFSSSWLSRGQHNRLTGETYVWFNDGHRWSGQMSYDEWRELITAPSSGKWWHSKKGNRAFWPSRY